MTAVKSISQATGLDIDTEVDAIRSVAASRLRRVEQEHRLRVLFACESGSRAWGFASRDSDFDVRFIFVRPAADYLRLRPPPDAFDIQGTDDSDVDLDLAGWDIRKAAELMRKSNGPLFEWLESPIIYEQDGNVAPRLIALRNEYFDPKKSIHHYLSLAGGVWKKYLADRPDPIRKKYLYSLRPLACVRYIDRHRRQPPTCFESVLRAIDLDNETLGAVMRLLEQKRNHLELGRGPADPVLNRWIIDALKKGEHLALSMPGSSADTSNLDRLIADAILTPEGTQ